MRTVKFILGYALYVITTPLVLLAVGVFAGVISLWRFAEALISREGSRSRDTYNRVLDDLHVLIDTYKF